MAEESEKSSSARWTQLRDGIFVRAADLEVASDRAKRQRRIADSRRYMESLDVVEAVPPVAAAKKSRVLVVDDDAEFLGYAEEVLKKAGFLVARASSGKQGLAEARTHRPDLVLLDLTMPDVDGRTVLVQLKNDPETVDIPVIVISGLESPDVPSAAAAVLPKVIPPEALAKKIRESLVKNQRDNTSAP